MRLLFKGGYYSGCGFYSVYIKINFSDHFIQLLSTSESFSDEESSSDYEETPSGESPNDEQSPTGHEDEEPCRGDKSNYSKESSDCNEQIISEGK